MPRFDVHIYAVVRVRLCNIEAETQDEAIAHAVESAELYSRFQDRQDRSGVDQEYDEREAGYLVQPLRANGEHDYDESRYYLDAKHIAGIEERRRYGHQLYFSPEYRAYLNRRTNRRKKQSSS
ncbi:MAG TPA: hypothetical protein VMP01_15730 [Pirellulaceae bacterium]|nr:hypothetical protein [Pirellulaceae bacterium]